MKVQANLIKLFKMTCRREGQMLEVVMKVVLSLSKSSNYLESSLPTRPELETWQILDVDQGCQSH